MTVDEFAAKLDLTTEGLVSKLDITVAEMATSLGLTEEQLATKLGLTTADLSGKMGMTIQQFASSIGYTIPQLAQKLGTTTSGLVGNLNMTMTQFAGRLGLTVDQLAGKFGLTTKGLANKLGQTYQQLTNPFGMSMSATVDALKSLEKEYSKILNDIESQSLATISRVNHAMDRYTNKSNNTTSTTNKNANNKTVTLGSRINAGSARIYADSYGGGVGAQYYGNDPIYTVIGENNGYWLVRYHKLSSGYTGWFKKSDVKAYAKGTKGVKEDQLALIDELGEELQLVPGKNGRLEYIKKGTGIVPANLTANLMEWGKLDPSTMLDQNRPQIGVSPSVVNNTTEIHIDASVGELLHVEHLDGNNPVEITKIVDKAWDKRMKELNGFIRKYSR
jgi:plasmid maintenance system antidote protein VapI